MLQTSQKKTEWHICNYERSLKKSRLELEQEPITYVIALHTVLQLGLLSHQGGGQMHQNFEKSEHGNCQTTKAMEGGTEKQFPLQLAGL